MGKEEDGPQDHQTGPPLSPTAPLLRESWKCYMSYPHQMSRAGLESASFRCHALNKKSGTAERWVELWENLLKFPI